MSDTATDVDIVDWSVLEQFWPMGTRYGQPGTWFAYVGRTYPQREGLRALRVQRGPRGVARLGGGTVRTRSTLSGEFQAK